MPHFCLPYSSPEEKGGGGGVKGKGEDYIRAREHQRARRPIRPVFLIPVSVRLRVVIILAIPGKYTHARENGLLRGDAPHGTSSRGSLFSRAHARVFHRNRQN